MDKNYFTTLNAIKCEVEKKNWLSYVSWADAWAEVKKIHPDASYTIYENQDWNAFWETKFGIDCKVGVTINGIEHIVRLPVMDWANNAMTDKQQTIEKERFVYQNKQKVWDKENNCYLKEKYKLIIEAATQFDINKTIQRAFTKAIAMHGIGLYVYRWEDLPESIEEVKPKHEQTTSLAKPYFGKANKNKLLDYVNQSGWSGWREDLRKLIEETYTIADEELFKEVCDTLKLI